MVELVETRLVVLGDVVEQVVRADPKKLAVDTFSYVDLGSVDQRRKIIDTEKSVATSEAPSRARQVLKSNDVLVSTVRPNLNGVARVPGRLDGSIASTGFCVLRPRAEQLDPNYLFHWVQSPVFIDGMVRKSIGASYPAVSDKIVLESYIPLPPLEQQRRVAAVLDKADELRTKRRQALAQVDFLAQSIFRDMFGTLSDASPLWPRVPIGEVCSAIVDCVNRTAPLADGPTPYKMIRTSNVRNREIDISNVRYVSRETFDVWNRRATPQRGDIVLTREAPMGEAGPISFDDEVFLGQRTMLYRPNPERLSTAYLLYYLTSSYMKRDFERHGTGTTVKHLSVPYCRSISIHLPPIELQLEFARRIAATERVRDHQRAQLAELDVLFAAVQHRAFTGAL